LPRLQDARHDGSDEAIGLMATLAGIDRFFNLLVDWSSYVSPVAAQLLRVT
jgi:hypothetical protein